MLATIPALWGESQVCGIIQSNKSVIAANIANSTTLSMGTDFKVDCLKDSLSGNLALLIIIIWVIIEEATKFGAVYFAALWRKENNEPIDSLMYLITGALGFAAAENTLYLLSALSTSTSAMQGILLGNFRFLGATLLHTVSSGSIGLALALSYFKPKWERFVSVIIGFIIAIALHTMFNLFILKSDTGNFLITFGTVWLAAISLLLFFEKVKEIHQKYYSTEPITETL
jgi:RsiW-degrading membrane proteinase PrsW (M82 family)